MQRRAQREALTPQKMKRDEWLLSNSSLSLEEKKKKILKNVSRLEASGLLQAPHSHTHILHLIAKVTNHTQTGRGQPPSQVLMKPSGHHRTSASGECSASAGGRSFRGWLRRWPGWRPRAASTASRWTTTEITSLPVWTT